MSIHTSDNSLAELYMDSFNVTLRNIRGGDNPKLVKSTDPDPESKPEVDNVEEEVKNASNLDCRLLHCR